jgi:hypothetical protein
MVQGPAEEDGALYACCSAMQAGFVRRRKPLIPGVQYGMG